MKASKSMKKFNILEDDNEETNECDENNIHENEDKQV